MLYYDFCRQALAIGWLKKTEIVNKRILIMTGFSSMSSKAEEFLMGEMQDAGADSCHIYDAYGLAGYSRFCGLIPNLIDKLDEAFDVVVVWDSLEKCKDIPDMINRVKVACRLGGLIIVMARTPQLQGNQYGICYYDDYWRFDGDMLAELFQEFSVLQKISISNGVLTGIKLRKIADRKMADISRVGIYQNAIHQVLPLEDIKHNYGYFVDYEDLDKVGRRYITDKNSCVHNYLNKYEFFLQKLRTEKFQLLELGVSLGGSLAMWRDYFPFAEITGVDIDEKCRQCGGDRTTVVIADLSEEEELDKLHAINPRVIIDDASHIWSHQIKALFNLWKCLPHGGIYILEDMETSVNKELFPGYGDFSMDAYEVCSRIAKVVASKEPCDDSICSGAINAIGMETELISVIHGSCVIIKR